MAFQDVRLSEDVERGSQGGPRFKTSILILSSGFEKRNIDFAQARGSWDIGYGVGDKEQFNEIIEFFYARQGRASSFRFKDWSDFEIGDDATDTPQTIATGDTSTTAFQIVRTYTSGPTTFDRVVTKIVASPTPRVFLDGVEQFADFTIDLLTGILTFTSAPAAVAIGVICEFDVAVRFDTDALDVNMLFFNAGSIPAIPVIEVRGE